MNIFDRRSSKERSLNDSCDWLEEHFGISLSKQSLDERYNTYAVSFMKECFEKLLTKVNELELNKLSLKDFSSIQLTDATSFRISDNLSTFYKGYKGNAGSSVLKIHLNCDLLNGQIEEISLGDGSVHDNAYVPVTKLATNQIRAVYSLRWQVEVMFKLWKSHYNIDKVKKMSIFRFECHIYAQLIVALLDFALQQAMEPIFLEELEEELSPIKATKLIKKNSIN